jgi:hypothetical protein
VRHLLIIPNNSRDGCRSPRSDNPRHHPHYCFVLYERYLAKYPMVPGTLFKGQRVMTLAFVIAFVAGKLSKVEPYFSKY